jgi:hypothetical protein
LFNPRWVHLFLQVKQDDDGFALEAQVPGQLMAQTYTRFKTMANIVNAAERLDMYGLLLVLAKVSHSTSCATGHFGPVLPSAATRGHLQ